MIVEKNTAPFVILSSNSIAAAIEKINSNLIHFVFCVSEHGLLEGILTNGDFLRWVVTQQKVDLEQPVEFICNRNVKSLPVNTPITEIAAVISDQIRVVPLVDERGHLVAIARPGSPEIRIGEFEIAADKPVFVIAEIGINHNGSLELAKQMVNEAVAAGADCVKFQMRHMKALYRNAGNPNDVEEDLGSQYTLDILSRFFLSDDEMFKIFDYSQTKGILPLCTPWDHESINALESYGVEAYKVASADLTNHDLLLKLVKTRKPILSSTGMSIESEIREVADLLRREGAPFILLHCNSTYPAPFKDINLNYLDRLREIGQCPVGYSGHERGFAVPLAAVARGAKVIEKHFTLDRNMEGNDHKVSLLPDEFKAMLEGIRNIEEAMGGGDTRQMTQGERMNRETLGKSLISTQAIGQGTVILDEMLTVMSPGNGLQPNMRNALVGRLAKRNLQPGDFFFPSDLMDGGVEPRKYRFDRPWGLPVRYHDYKALTERAIDVDFLEFHLSYKDMENSVDRFFQTALDLDFTVHSPDLFPGDHLLNLAEEDDTYRRRSMNELQRAIDTALALEPFFKRATRPIKLIVSLGGFSKSAPLPLSARTKMYDRVAESLAQLDTVGIEILPQSLPPFPWYIGGQLFCNLFVDPEDTAQFCKDTGYRVCFDASHSKLACNHRKTSFKDFTEIIAPHTGHLHIVDATGVDGEGLQIGEGEIDFSLLVDQLNQYCPDAGFIPEIWQGHKNGGEGFWIALDRLERWF
jgi:N-acetylneuraminate synthase